MFKATEAISYSSSYVQNVLDVLKIGNPTYGWSLEEQILNVQANLLERRKGLFELLVTGYHRDMAPSPSQYSQRRRMSEFRPKDRSSSLQSPSDSRPGCSSC